MIFPSFPLWKQEWLPKRKLQGDERLVGSSKKQVDFLNFVENPYIYLRKSDVFVLSSRYEGFGNVIVEALAVGLPVVSTNCPGGPKEILDNGKYGKLVQTEDANAMAEAIIETLKSKIDREVLIGRAQKYSVQTISDQYINLFLSIMNE